MNIKTRVNLILVIIFSLLALSLGGTGYMVITGITYRDHLNTFSRELSNIDLSIQESYRELQNAHLLELESYVTAEKERLLKILANYEFGKTGELYIVDLQGTVLLHNKIEPGKPFLTPFIQQMLREKKGHLEYKHINHDHFSVFQTSSHWNWLLVLSISEDELLASRDRFLAFGGLLCSLLFLCVLFLLSNLFRPFMARISLIANSLQEVRQGNLKVRITKVKDDEIGIIESGINSMIETVDSKTEELEKLLKAAVVSSQAKSEFVSNMSHEIRTPMNSILGFAEILNSKETDPEKSGYLNNIHSSGKVLLSLINDILDLSKIEAGKLELQYSATSIAGLFEEMRIIFEQKILNKGLRLIIELSDTIPKALILDEIRLRQILINLIGNANKFTSSGHILISASATEKSSENRVDLNLEVKDTGLGIPENQQAKIFEAFEQIKGQKIKDHNGTGLGLTISNRLIEMMNGEIRIESEVGKGSTFKITLFDVEISHTEALSVKEEKELNYQSIIFEPATILIGDDIDYNREMLATYLQDWDFTFLHAENGKKVIEQTKKYQPDLILLDMKMPEMDGHETSAFLKKNPTLKTIPIIAVTASALKQDEEIIAKLCDGYLRKPVGKAELVRDIMRFLPHTVTQKQPTRGVETREPVATYQEELSEQFATLPDEWTEKAIILADKGLYFEILDHLNLIRESSPAVAEQLICNALNCDFDRIIELLRSKP